ncbi:SAF domain-containing protein [Intrasporangium sp.]|uniref:SAF domain-containing protein n=1 Tax=Intrasporangium sp. TaxID=1925024 RepID=UPI00293B2E71|nr:SAF domain-containing protein [Intrasporangium sp.]MDV3221877.1 SAF domain-containing protein [Intrasporangium sp.]
MAASLAGVAAAVALSVLRPAGAADVGVPTVVAAHRLPAGAVISPDDVRIEARQVDQRPESATADPSDLVGRRAAGPIEAKGIITSERLTGPGLLSGRSDGRVAMTLPVMEIALSGVRPGTRVDVYATGTGSRVVADAQVLAVTGGSGAVGDSGDSGDGAVGGTPGAPMPWPDEADPGITVAVSATEAPLLARGLSALSAGESFVLAVRPDP